MGLEHGICGHEQKAKNMSIKKKEKQIIHQQGIELRGKDSVGKRKRRLYKATLKEYKGKKVAGKVKQKMRSNEMI